MESVITNHLELFVSVFFIFFVIVFVFVFDIVFDLEKRMKSMITNEFEFSRIQFQGLPCSAG